MINELEGIENESKKIKAIADIMRSINPDDTLHRDTLPELAAMIFFRICEIERRTNLIWASFTEKEQKRLAKSYSKE